jgi:hypothetical protein
MVSGEGEHNPFKSVKSFVSGGVAGVIAKSMIAPIERIKYLFIVKRPNI